MRREKKKEAVGQLADKLSQCSIAIATDYRGLSVTEMTELRRRLRQGDIEYRVVKNTLTRFAAAQANKEELTDIIEGPVALAFGYGDVIEPAKALADYIQSSKSSLKIRGGLLERRVLSASEVMELASLPPKEVLIAKMLGGMQAPIVALASVLSGVMSGFLGVLNARIEQLEGEGYGS